MREGLVKITGIIVSVLLSLGSVDICEAESLQGSNLDSKIIQEKVETTINGKEINSFILKECNDDRNLLSYLEHKFSYPYIKLHEQSIGPVQSFVYVPRSSKIDSLVFAVSSKIELKTETLCLLSYLSSQDIEAIINPTLSRIKIDPSLIEDSSYLEVDMNINYRIKNYLLSIYHAKSKLKSLELKDKLLEDLSSNWKKISSSHPNTVLDGRVEEQSVWIRNTSRDTRNKVKKSKTSDIEDKTLFVDLRNKGEVSIYEIFGR